MSLKIKELKSLDIEDLYEEDQCHDHTKEKPYIDTMKKAEHVRNSFFLAKAAFINFIRDCTDICDEIEGGDTTMSLEEVEHKYHSIFNTLLSSLHVAFTVEYGYKKLINVSIIKLKDIDDAVIMRSNKLEFRHPKSKVQKVISTLSYIPGITICINIENHELQIIFSEPEFISTFHPVADEEKIVTYTVCGPTIDLDESSVFESFNTCRRFLDDVINYRQFHATVTDLYLIIKYLDKVIASVENSHRTVVQLAKVAGIIPMNSDRNCATVPSSECEDSLHTGNCVPSSQCEDSLHTRNKCMGVKRIGLQTESECSCDSCHKVISECSCDSCKKPENSCETVYCNTCSQTTDSCSCVETVYCNTCSQTTESCTCETVYCNTCSQTTESCACKETVYCDTCSQTTESCACKRLRSHEQSESGETIYCDTCQTTTNECACLSSNNSTTMSSNVIIGDSFTVKNYCEVCETETENCICSGVIIGDNYTKQVICETVTCDTCQNETDSCVCNSNNVQHTKPKYQF